MKKILLALLLSQAASFGAITISGNFGTGFGTAAPVGGLFIFVMDNGSNGLLGTPSLSGTVTSSADPHILSANTSTNVGSSFGGDLIIGRATVTAAGVFSTDLVIADQTFAGQGRNFALIYFPTLTAASVGAVPNGTAYGIVRGTDWVLPTADGLYTLSTTFGDTTDTVLARVTQSAGTVNNAVFGTATSAFAVGAVPEPSVALLGGLAALGFLRRRRN